MKVKELIEKLKEFDQEKDVLYFGEEGNSVDIINISNSFYAEIKYQDGKEISKIKREFILIK